MTELKNFCPFCRKENVQLNSLAGTFFAVSCRSCQASGSLELSKEKAVQRWNALANAYIEMFQC